MTEHFLQNNVERFSGYGALYNQNRPKAPDEVVKILTMYLGHNPLTVVDVGCGTGLSTFLWLDCAKRIIGVEPGDDMRDVAKAEWHDRGCPENLEFIKAMSDKIPLDSESVDIITCSQSFHWMDPQPTLHEFARLLKPGGVFAAYDYDWPPVLGRELEESYRSLNRLADESALQLAPDEQKPHRWSKNEHLKQIEGSRLFPYSREIVFHNWENCDADRFANLACSQSGLQSALKLGDSNLQAALDDFRKQVTLAFRGETREILFSYRMRLGVK